MTQPWPTAITVAQIRIARPTARLKEVETFYREGLGLPLIGSFSDHAGYSGIMLGLPGKDYHLEFTEHTHGSPCPAPSKDNLLVLYLPQSEDVEAMAQRLARLGHHPVPPENPYWEGKSLTFEDPDGWRVVFMNTKGI